MKHSGSLKKCGVKPHFLAKCQLVNGIYQPLDDGSKTIYANTIINDGTDQSELLALFEKRDTFSSAKFPKLSEVIKYYNRERSW